MSSNLTWGDDVPELLKSQLLPSHLRGELDAVYSRSPSRPGSRPSSRPGSRPGSRPSSRPPSPPGFDQTDDSDVISTAIVIKNIPFSVKKDALLNKLNSLDIPAPYAFNYHFDNGVFRGLAFANYRDPKETEIVINAVNGLEIGGRKLRVEYKKLLQNEIEKKKELNNDNNNNNNNNNSKKTQQQEEDGLDLNDPEVLELYNELLMFRSGSSQSISLSNKLSSKHRKFVHLIAERLELAHYSEGFDDERHVVVAKKDSAAVKRVQKQNSRSNLKQSPSRERLNLLNDKTTYKKSMMNNTITPESLPKSIIHPVRQPRGPEPGNNFASRKAIDPNQLAADLARQKLSDVTA